MLAAASLSDRLDKSVLLGLEAYQTYDTFSRPGAACSER